MTETNQTICVRWKNNVNKWAMTVDIYSKTTKQILYSVSLMEIYDHEIGLNTGRFEHFVLLEQKYISSIAIENCNNIIISDVQFEDLTHVFGAMVNWIAERTSTPWSVDIQMNHMNSTTFKFSFFDERLAVFFKMAWS